MLEEVTEDLFNFSRDYKIAGTFDRRSFGITLNHDASVLEELLAAGPELEGLLHIPEYFEAQLTFVHEWNHWWQQLGTAYGYLQLEAEDCTMRSVGTFFADYRKLQPRTKYPRPLAAWALDRIQNRQRVFSRHRKAGGDLDSYLGSIHVDPSNNILCAMVMGRVIELCEGDAESNLLIAHFMYGQLWQGLAANQESISPSVRKGLSELSYEDPPSLAHLYSAAPQISGLGTFGARQIAEGQAHIAELMTAANLFNQQGKRRKINDYMRNVAAEEYDGIVKYFIRTCGGQATSEVDLLLTFLCICDLALSTPMHPCFFPIAQSLRWKDLHPGWRFVSACRSLAEVGTLNNDELSLDVDRYNQFIRAICERLSWPSPLQMAEHFREKTTSFRSLSLHTAFLAEASTVRLAHPTVFALLSFDDVERTQLLRDRLPQPFIAYGKGDERKFHLPQWAIIDESDQRQFAFDLMKLSDVFRATELLLYDWSNQIEVTKFFNGAIDDVLEGAWNVRMDEFRTFTT